MGYKKIVLFLIIFLLDIGYILCHTDWVRRMISNHWAVISLLHSSDMI